MSTFLNSVRGFFLIGKTLWENEPQNPINLKGFHTNTHKKNPKSIKRCLKQEGCEILTNFNIISVLKRRISSLKLTIKILLMNN